MTPKPATVAARWPHDRSSDHDDTTCTLGGSHLDGGGPDSLPVKVGNFRPARGVAGNDSTDPRIVNCCAPFPVNYVEPCALWCQFDPTIWNRREDLFTCLEGVGVKPQFTVTWHTGKGWWRDTFVPGGWDHRIHPAALIGALLVFILIVIGSALAVVRWRRKAWWKRTMVEVVQPIITLSEERSKDKVRLPYGTE